jgi:hypothetical protein
MTLVTEHTARQAAASVRERPLTIYLPPLQLSAAGYAQDEEADRDYEDE